MRFEFESASCIVFDMLPGSSFISDKYEEEGSILPLVIDQVYSRIPGKGHGKVVVRMAVEYARKEKKDLICVPAPIREQYLDFDKLREWYLSLGARDEDDYLVWDFV